MGGAPSHEKGPPVAYKYYTTINTALLSLLFVVYHIKHTGHTITHPLSRISEPISSKPMRRGGHNNKNGVWCGLGRSTAAAAVRSTRSWGLSTQDDAPLGVFTLASSPLFFVFLRSCVRRMDYLRPSFLSPSYYRRYKIILFAGEHS